MLALLERPIKPLWPFVLNAACDQAQGLVGWWPGGPSGGLNWFDLAGHGAKAAFAAIAPVWDVGNGGGRGALRFDGTVNQRVVATAQAAINNTKTQCFWIYRSSNNTGSVADKSDGNVTTGEFGISINISANGDLSYNREFSVSNKSLRTTTTFPLNTWTHVCIVWDGTVDSAGWKIYFNGNECSYASTGSGSGTSSGAGQDLYIGAGRSGISSTTPIVGSLEDFRLYNRMLTRFEVAALYTPATRWQLRYQPGRTKWFVGASLGIQFDAASNSGYQAAQSTYSWSHTCTGSNRFLAVDVSLLSAGSTVTGITYNGVALSLIKAQSTVTSFGRVECWGLANPASGSNTIAVTLSGSITSAGTAASYTGVHQTTPTEAANSNQATNVGAADATVAITSVADQDWIHAAIATDDAAITAGQTSRNNVTGLGGSGADEDFGPQSPGAKTMSYTDVGALATWAIAGYAIRPVGASGNNYTRTASDSPSSSDAVTRTEVLARSVADSIASSDSVARSETLSRPATDSLTSSDTVVRVQVLARSATDTPQSSDTVTRIETLFRTLADTFSSSDSVARILVLNRSATDIPTSADVATRAFVGTRSLTDNFSSADAVASVQSKTRSASDSTSSTDLVATVIAHARFANDVFVSSDAVARVLALARTTTDVFNSSDAVIATISTTTGAIILDMMAFFYPLDEMGFTTLTLDQQKYQTIFVDPIRFP